MYCFIFVFILGDLGIKWGDRIKSYTHIIIPFSFQNPIVVGEQTFTPRTNRPSLGLSLGSRRAARGVVRNGACCNENRDNIPTMQR